MGALSDRGTSYFIMVINFYGEGCFKIQSGNLVILSDPFDKNIGLTPPRMKTDITLKTFSPLPFPEKAKDTEETELIVGAGEYNIKGIIINGFAVVKESTEKFLKTIYLVDIEDLRLCFLGHISNSLEPSILEYLEKVDILFVPAGGEPFIEQKSAVKLTKQLQPKIIIPSFFRIPSLKRKADDLKIFLAELNGLKGELIKEQDKLTVKKKEVAAIKTTEVTVLKI